MKLCRFRQPNRRTQANADQGTPNRQNKDLLKLSDLGHFLKGIAATLGVVKVRDSCEMIQKLGRCEVEDGSQLDRDESLVRIKMALRGAMADYRTAERKLRLYCEDSE